MSKKSNTTTKVLTPMFRVSFPALFQPTAMDEKSTPKYGVTMLFPKSTDLSVLEKAYKIALKKGIEEKWKGKKPKNLRSPFRDGDEEEDYNERDGFPGHIFIRASSLQKPGVVDKNCDPILDPAEVYAGCYARATVVAYPYDVAGNRGIAFGLQNLQKLKDGEAFSGRKPASQDFDEWEDDDDDYDDDDGYDDDDDDGMPF